MTVEVADVLDKAADLIDPALGGRWIRGQLRDGEGGYCILGAVGRALDLPMLATEFTRSHKNAVLAQRALTELLDERPESWNDQDCLDGHEAANVLRKAAEIERAGVAESGRMDRDRASAAPTSPDDGVGQQTRIDPAVSHPGT